MRVVTKNFGEIEIADDKIIVFENGIVGFPELTQFALIHDEEKGENAGIRWMQSMQEPAFAMPVMDPLVVMPEYNPEVEDEMLKVLGEITPAMAAAVGSSDAVKILLPVNRCNNLVIGTGDKSTSELMAEAIAKIQDICQGLPARPMR